MSQIAITALSLPFLSQAHWVAQGFWIFSLISGIMAVYHASAQHRTMGRLLLPGQVRGWIRGKHADTDDIFIDIEALRRLFQAPPSKLFPDLASSKLFEPFLPGLSSVLTISAPQLLLSASLYSFLAGLGVYVSFVWRRRLDPSASFNDSRNIFITYMVSLTVCEVIYSISSVASLAAVGPKRGTPWNIVSTNCKIFYTKALEDFDRLQAERQQNLSESEQSGQLSPTHARRTSPTAPTQAIQNQLSALAATETLHASTPAPETNVHEPRTTTSSQSHVELPWVSPQHQVLIEALQDSARLRRESAKLEELIARCYEELLDKQKAVDTTNQDWSGCYSKPQDLHNNHNKSTLEYTSHPQHFHRSTVIEIGYPLLLGNRKALKVPFLLAIHHSTAEPFNLIFSAVCFVAKLIWDHEETLSRRFFLFSCENMTLRNISDVLRRSEHSSAGNSFWKHP